jgi:CheY-like chemotaxis protein
MEKKLLIVEDDADIREDLAEILRHEGYPVATAANGQEALAELRDRGGQALPGLILLDLMMPVKNGWDFRAEQLGIPAIADIPIILLSGASDVRHQASVLKAAGYLTKPIQLERLMQLVKEHCG